MRRKIEQALIDWKNNDGERKPILLNGARQVGKTYSLRKFGEEYYKNVIYVNLEVNKTVASYFSDNIEPKHIIQSLEAFYEQAILPDETLIILDEIQSNERALTSLKYFCEDASEYHIAAAGSLLGVAINRSNYSFPVGKVARLMVYPFDFEEFLWANEKGQLAEQIALHFETNQPLPEPLHQLAFELYRKYLVIGGMPAAINQYLKTGRTIDVPDVQNVILDDYIADMAKYASNSESVLIRAAFNSIPNQLAKDNRKFQYKLAQKGGTATIFGPAIEWLSSAGTVLKCLKINHGEHPIAVFSDLSHFKLYMSDVGLLTLKTGLSHQIIFSDFISNNLFLGALTENYVACALASKGYPLYYWQSRASAEVDFVIEKDGKVIPIEVKAGTNTRSKSLNLFMEKYQPDYAIRVSAKNFGFDNQIKSVPLYAIYCI